MTTSSNNTHSRSKTAARFTQGAAREGKMGALEHVVQFYETDECLLDTLSGFVGHGLAAGGACIVITTQAHRTYLERHLKANGLNLAAARARSQYVALDAAETLSLFMADGLPVPDRFVEVVAGTLARASQGRRQVRIFGEMVALLWREGNQAAAIRLEELWNDLIRRHATSPISLFCAYPMSDFAGEGYAASFAEICGQHARVIPAESYPALADPDQRLSAICRLQQQAQSLQAEIAEREVAEERLQHSENRYRRLFEASLDGILLVDPHSYAITDANAAATELLGYTSEQLLDNVLWHVGLFQDRESTVEVLRTRHQAQDRRSAPIPLRTQGQHSRDIELVCNQYRADGHDVIQCTLRDVTENKRLEQQTHETLQAVLAIVRTLVAAPDVGNVLNRFSLGQELAELVRRILPLRYASLFTVVPGTEQLELLAVAGYTPAQEKLLRERNTGLPLSARISDPAQRRRLLAGQVVVLDVTQPHFEEQRRLYGSTQGVLVPLRVGDRFIGTLGMNPLEGVTLTERELALAEGVAQMAALVIERERLQREREEARASAMALREANRQMNAFLGIASHELRTPVTSMKANVQLSARAVQALQVLPVPESAVPKLQRAVELLAVADRQANKLNHLIEDLLDITRIQSGTLELRRERADLCATAREVVEQVRLAWPARTVSLSLPDGPIVLEFDATRMSQVIANFLTNALKYSDPEEPVAVSVAREGPLVRVAVTDRGPGLSATQQERLWELFHRVPGIQQLSGSGTGLGIGLYICKTIIEGHGGQVGIDSCVGDGSTFWFTLPTTTAAVEEESK